MNRFIQTVTNIKSTKCLNVIQKSMVCSWSFLFS